MYGEFRPTYFQPYKLGVTWLLTAAEGVIMILNKRNKRRTNTRICYGCVKRTQSNETGVLRKWKPLSFNESWGFFIVIYRKRSW